MKNDTARAVDFDGITLSAERVCGNPDGYDRITADDPATGRRLIEISWHRDTRRLGLTLHDDRRWSFEAVEQMRQLGMHALWWSEDAVGTDVGEKSSAGSAGPG